MTSEDMEMELEAYLATHANAAAGDAPPILAEGTHVGEWTVTGFIGRGGSSEVYCASATQGHVALKVLVRDTPAQRAAALGRMRVVNGAAQNPVSVKDAVSRRRNRA